MKIPAVYTLGFGLLVAACSAPDPGVGGFGPRADNSPDGTGDTTTQPTKDAGKGTGTGTGTGTGNGTGNGDGTGGGNDAGTGGTPDAGPADTGGGPKNAFTGAPAFASKPVATSAKQSHTANAVGVIPGKATACVDCHKLGGASPAPFLAAGTVFTDTAGTTPAVDYEVRFVDSKGAAFSAHTDADGNFWINPPLAAATGPFITGVRNATAVKPMITQAGDGNCSSASCHGGATGPVHIP
jgi:hypothetical protein